MVMKLRDYKATITQESNGMGSHLARSREARRRTRRNRPDCRRIYLESSNSPRPMVMRVRNKLGLVLRESKCNGCEACASDEHDAGVLSSPVAPPPARRIRIRSPPIDERAASLLNAATMTVTAACIRLQVKMYWLLIHAQSRALVAEHDVIFPTLAGSSSRIEFAPSDGNAGLNPRPGLDNVSPVSRLHAAVLAFYTVQSCLGGGEGPALPSTGCLVLAAPPAGPSSLQLERRKCSDDVTVTVDMDHEAERTGAVGQRKYASRTDDWLIWRNEAHAGSSV
ncbi:hypothetical protein NLG97_g10187 [Lecanicillium saksenae]|uniref:Uncharacterized protein n=1 Tax=Lecanicillium saksenae TaxID=468837 RepID=A0ACC1QDX4_9HYPO|nr:hypothetical protein NLG97_g10187 [Lecanicillium saksenae]